MSTYMILDDQMLIQDTVDMIRKKKVNAEWALDLTFGKTGQSLQGYRR